MRKLYWLAVGVVVVGVLWPQTGSAIPAFGRKYSLDCATCHEPANAPRLTAVGHQFRKAGYRFEADFEKQPEYKEIGDYVATRFRFRYQFTNRDPAASSDDRNEFKFNDVTFFYAGAITKNLSLWTEWEWEANDEIAMSAYLSWTQGTWDRYWKVRLGQMKPIVRVGWGGLDRPVGIGTAEALVNRDMTVSPVPFRLSEEQRGLEVMYAFSPETRIVGSVWNGVDSTGNGRPDGVGDDNNDKDGLVYIEHMIDERGSAVTVFGYRGVLTTTNDVDFTFYRVGGSFNYVFPSKTEVQFGYLYGNDEADAAFGGFVAGQHGEGQAGWIELQQWLDHGSAVFVRLDMIQPDLQEGSWDNEWKKKLTLGGVYSVNDYLRLAVETFLERTFTSNGSLSSTILDNWGFVTEAMLNF